MPVMEAYISFMTRSLSIGHLECLIHHGVENIPSQEEVLGAITQPVLNKLGGVEEDWIIISDPNINNQMNNYFTYSYSFDWKQLNNKERTNPLMRTTTFREHRHRFEIFM